MSKASTQVFFFLQFNKCLSTHIYCIISSLTKRFFTSKEHKRVCVGTVWSDLLSTSNHYNLIKFRWPNSYGHAAYGKQKDSQGIYENKYGKERGRDHLQTVSERIILLSVQSKFHFCFDFIRFEGSLRPLTPPSNAIKIYKLFPGIKGLKDGLFHASLRLGRSVFVCEDGLIEGWSKGR